MTNDDYSPIAADGTIERERGLLGRYKRRASLPPVGHGFERVMVDADGKITGGTNLTAGEKYWAQAASWVKVDVSEHHIIFSFSISDPSGGASYDVSTALNVKVAHGGAADAVRNRATSVKAVLMPLVVSSAKEAMRKVDHDESLDGSASSDVLQRALSRAERVLRDCLVGSQTLGSPSWLHVTITAVDVRFDTHTTAHIEALRQHGRTAKLEDLSVVQSIAMRTKWRTHLAEHLLDRDARAIEVVLDDPSPQRIQDVVNQLNHAESARRAEMIGVLRTLLESNYNITDVAEIRTIRAIVDGLQPEPEPSNAPIPGGSEIPAIPADSSEEVSAEMIADREWTNP